MTKKQKRNAVLVGIAVYLLSKNTDLFGGGSKSTPVPQPSKAPEGAQSVSDLLSGLESFADGAYQPTAPDPMEVEGGRGWE